MRIERQRTAALLLLAMGLSLPASSAAFAEPPKFTPEQMGGTLRGNFNAEPQTLNPLTYKDVYAAIVHDRVFESLIERDPDTLEFGGLLAERWEVSADGKVITFYLNPKARFSDGTPVTADDVVFTYETIMNPKIDARSVASYFEDCQGCEKVDNLTVRFTWKKVYFKSLETSGILVIPKHVYEFKDPNEFNEINDKLVGSGPYKFGEWKTGQHLVLVRNENYWRRPPAIDRVAWRFILEDQAAVQALLAGELDELGVAPEWWVKLEPRADVRERFQMLRYSSPGNGYTYIGWNNAKPLFADRRVRLAMTHLVWRRELMKYLLYDIGEVITGPFWSKSPQYDRTIQPWPFSREEALRLLKEAGWEDRNGDGWLENEKGERFEFELCSATGNPLTRDIVRILQEELRRVGMDMHVRLYEWSVFTLKLDNHDFDAVMLGWSGAVEDDPYQIWHSSQIADRGSNFISFRSVEADRLIEEARVTLDAAKRSAIYHRFHRLLHEQQPYTFLWSRESLRLVSKRIKGVKVHTLGLDWRDWWIGKDEAKEAAVP